MLFVTREPVTRQRSGSTTAVLNLLHLLDDHGAPLTVVVTLAYSRSPRLVFRSTFDLPAGCTLRVPGYLRLGRWYLRPFSPLPWMRAAVRVLRRVPRLRPLRRWIEHLAGDRLYANTWDLTEPTDGERALLLRTVKEQRPRTVLANYAFWGAALAGVAGMHRALLMHDLLSEHVRLFQERGMPLDCPEITPAEEIAWLNGADTVIAIQQAEAEAVQARVRATVVVQPIRLLAREADVPVPGRCLFVGSDTPPNVQGLQWLLREVWPHVLAAHPSATLSVAGAVGHRWSGPLPGGVVLHGPVASLDEAHRRAAVCLVPLLVGSGLKIKLLDALSHGKATVSTSIGVQGLERWAADAVAVADAPADFAAEVVRLLRHDALRRSREQAATAVVRAHFTAGSVAEQELLERLLG